MLSVSTQITKEESLYHFERMLKSVAFANEIIIYNMGRKDPDFFSIAKKFQAKIYHVQKPTIVEMIRARQIRDASFDWVLILDGDEVVTKELSQEIKRLISNQPATYALSRKNYSLGWPMNHGGFGDDFVPRLFAKSLFLDWPKEIHALPKVKGEIKTTFAYLQHHKDESLEQMVNKTNRYSDVEAQQFFLGGLRVTSSLTLIRKWWMESFRRGVLKGGLLDGKIGLIQSLYQGFSVLISYAKLYEKSTQNTTTKNSLHYHYSNNSSMVKLCHKFPKTS